MGSLENRLSRLEGLIQPLAWPEGEAAALRRALVRDILDELARLKASRAVHYRGGTPMVRIEPEDIPGKILGPDYTKEDVMELARRRVLERLERHLTREEVIRAARILAGEEEEPGQ
jgi:hypothetical protein